MSDDPIQMLRRLHGLEGNNDVSEGLQVFQQLEQFLPQFIACCFDNTRQDKSTPLLISLIARTKEHTLVPLRFTAVVLRTIGTRVSSGHLQTRQGCPARAFALLHAVLVENKCPQHDFQEATKSLSCRPLLSILACALVTVKTSGDKQKKSVGKYLFKALLASPIKSADQAQRRKTNLSLAFDVCLQRLQLKHRSLVQESVTFIGNLMLVDGQGQTILAELKLLFVDVLQFDLTSIDATEEQATYSKVVRLLSQLVHHTASASQQKKLPYTLGSVLQDEVLRWCNGGAYFGVLEGKSLATMVIPSAKARERAVRICVTIFEKQPKMAWALTEHFFGDSTASVRVAAIDRIDHLCKHEHGRLEQELQRHQYACHGSQSLDDGEQEHTEKQQQQQTKRKREPSKDEISAHTEAQARLQRVATAWMQELQRCAQDCARDSAVGVRIAGLELCASLVRLSAAQVQMQAPNGIEKADGADFIQRGSVDAQSLQQKSLRQHVIKSAQMTSRAGFSGLLQGIRDQHHSVRICALRKMEDLSSDITVDALVDSPSTLRYRASLVNQVAELVVHATPRAKGSVAANAAQHATAGRSRLMAASFARTTTTQQQDQQDEDWAAAVDDCTGALIRDYLQLCFDAEKADAACFEEEDQEQSRASEKVGLFDVEECAAMDPMSVRMAQIAAAMAHLGWNRTHLRPVWDSFLPTIINEYRIQLNCAGASVPMPGDESEEAEETDGLSEAHDRLGSLSSESTLGVAKLKGLRQSGFGL
jgi:hypothetical protein